MAEGMEHRRRRRGSPAPGRAAAGARGLAEVEPEMGEADVRGGRPPGRYSPRIARPVSASERLGVVAEGASMLPICTWTNTAPVRSSGYAASAGGLAQRRQRRAHLADVVQAEARFESSTSSLLRSPSARVSEITCRARPAPRCAVARVEQDAEVGVVLDLAAAGRRARAFASRPRAPPRRPDPAGPG